MKKSLSLFLLVGLIFVLVCLPVLALAQEGDAPHDKVMLGQYALPVVLVVVLGIIYWVAEDKIPNRFKPLIAIGVGIGLGILAMFMKELEPNFYNTVNYILFGFMAGAAAIGLYEGKKALSKKHR